MPDTRFRFRCKLGSLPARHVNSALTVSLHSVEQETRKFISVYIFNMAIAKPAKLGEKLFSYLHNGKRELA
jgi:hypothetical protein